MDLSSRAEHAGMPEEGTGATRKDAAAAVSGELVSLHKQFYGKGPVRAKTFLIDDTCCACSRAASRSSSAR